MRNKKRRGNSREKEEVMCCIERKKRRRRNGRWERKRRRTETIIALSYHCTVINSLLVRESVPRLGPSPMTNHLHPALRARLFMIKQLIRAGHGGSWASIRLGPRCRDSPVAARTSTPPSTPTLPSTLTAASAHRPPVRRDGSPLRPCDSSV